MQQVVPAIKRRARLCGCAVLFWLAVCASSCVSPTSSNKPLAPPPVPSDKPVTAPPVTPPQPQPAKGDLEVLVEAPADVIKGQRFDVRVKLVNRSAVPQVIRVMSCAQQDNWSVKGGQVRLEIHTCHANFPREETINPGSTYETTLRLVGTVSEPKADNTTATFRIGFYSLGGKLTYWSDLVKVLLAPSADDQGP